MSTIEGIVGDIAVALQEKNQARDRALVETRHTVRHSANAIRALHRGQTAQAKEHLAEGRSMIGATRRDLEGHPDIYWAGYVQDSHKEYAEANLVAAMINDESLPGPGDIGVELAPYLNGMAEAASEMRRYVLDIIRRGGPEETRQAERILGVMDDVYTSLITVDYPDGITGGLRRTVDALRAVLERTRGDLTISIRQDALARALAGASGIQGSNETL
ncbi:MAG: haloacid dehalogenase [Chloroflexota bacterium]